MRSGIESVQFLQQLSEEDARWILDSGQEIEAPAGTILIQQGQPGSRILILMQGLLVVQVDELPLVELSLLVPGEIVGEVAFLEAGSASATVVARESSRVLSIDYEQFHRKFEEDEGFKGRFHGALAKLLARRLRRNAQRIPDHVQGEMGEIEAKLVPSLQKFKEWYLRAEELERSSSEGIDEEFCEQFLAQLQQLELQTNETIGAARDMSPAMREHLSRRMTAELLPYILSSRIAERSYTKPRGYAGDYLTIEWLYQDEPSGVGALGTLFDRAILGLGCSKAVQHRRKILSDQISQVVKERAGDPAEITSLACGPAREVYDHYVGNPHGSTVRSHLVDLDAEALEFVGKWRDELGLTTQIDLHHLNLVHLILGRHVLDLPQQDLVYSIGLIDYFDDNFVIRLLDYIHGILRPGGKVILGNFHPSNRSRGLMDHVFDWKLIHRDEDDMNRIFEKSVFGRGCTEILFEQQGINLFACCQR